MRAQQHFGAVLRRHRDTRGMTQSTVASLSQFHRSYIADLERGAANPSLGTILRIAAALGLSAAEFMRRVEVEIKRDPNYEEEPKQPLRNPKMKKKQVAQGEPEAVPGNAAGGMTPDP